MIGLLWWLSGGPRKPTVRQRYRQWKRWRNRRKAKRVVKMNREPKVVVKFPY